MCFTAGFQLYIFQFSRRGKHIFLFCWGSIAPTATWVWLCYLVWNSNTWTSTTSWSFLHLFQEIGSESNWNRKITRKMRYSRYQLHQHYYTTCRRKKMRNMLRSHIWPKKTKPTSTTFPSYQITQQRSLVSNLGHHSFPFLAPMTSPSQFFTYNSWTVSTSSRETTTTFQVKNKYILRVFQVNSNKGGIWSDRQEY